MVNIRVSPSDAPEAASSVEGTASDALPAAYESLQAPGPQLSGAHQLELKQLRAQVVPAVTALPRSVEPSEVPPEWTRFVDEAVEGLHDELSAVSQQRTLNEIPLRGGTVRERGASRQVVRFEADSEPTVKDGMPATLVLKTGVYEVEVISIYGVMVTLAVPTQALVEERATLRCDLSYLTSYQAKRLRELRRPQEDFDVRAALSVVPPDPGEPERAEPYWVGDLNEQQSQAVGQALTKGTTWIWGPPGTGKTTTLAALLVELFAGRQRILLTGPTNTAVDVALEAVLRQVGEYEPGSIVRVGQPALTSLRHRETPVLANELVDARSAPLQKSHDDASEDLESLRARHKELSAAHGDAPEMRSIEVRIAEHQAYLRELDRIRADARRAVAAYARLVAATAHQTLLATLKGQTFDVVVIDEASMLPASLAALAAGAGRGHTIVAGDFRQLPPVVVSEASNARRWLGRSAFEAAGIDRRVLHGNPPGNLVALKLQHRMPAPLADAVTAGFYRENPLESAPHLRHRFGEAGRSGCGSIVRIDTSSLRPRVAKRGGTGSRYNLMHAILVAAVLGKRDLSGRAPALISPFAPQARLLESLVPEGGAGGEASTVHRFQGGERDVVIVDAVESAAGAVNLHPWFAEGDDGTSGARLVNVAASRARERLILVADFERVHRSRGKDDALARFFRAVQHEADDVQPGEVVPPEVLFRQPDLDSLRFDLDSAQHRIEIWSQRVDANAMVDLIRPLLDAASRGVHVTLWHEPDGRDVPVALKSLQRSEVILRPCLPVRESLAIVDDTVWAASGPLLSAVAAHTMRLVHKPLAEAVRRMTRRRELGGSSQSGESDGRCGICGWPIVRLESTFQTRAACLHCDAQQSRSSRRPPR